MRQIIQRPRKQSTLSPKPLNPIQAKWHLKTRSQRLHWLLFELTGRQTANYLPLRRILKKERKSKLLFRVQGLLGFGDAIPMVENQMAKEINNDMGTWNLHNLPLVSMV